ncbi:MAG TPA: ferredoxin [Rectinemataceae bacterium]|nr:ferredoxin [Rectinemataceae bacterium]
MANPAERNTYNSAGAWYVDSSCIACGLCTSLAPATFEMSADGSAAFVAHQPAQGADLEASASAMSDCPVQAIGNDG